MSAPTNEEKERARALYLSLLADRRPVREAGQRAFYDALFCVQISVRIANHVAEIFGLPKFPGPAWCRGDETAIEWIDRVAANVARWQRGEVEIQERNERRGRHRAETRGGR